MAHDTHRQNGAAIRRIRRERGIKSGELAARVDVARPTLTKWENGGAQASWERLYRLAQALDVPLVSILSEQGQTEHHREQVSA